MKKKSNSDNFSPNKKHHAGNFYRSRSLGKNASKKNQRRYCDEIWRELVKERDGGKCYLCGKETNLNVHHLISRKCLSTRFEVNNGIVLCSGCHLFRITSAHHSPWILFEKIEKERPEQYKWFLNNRTEEKLLLKSNIDYIKTINTLLDQYYILHPNIPDSRKGIWYKCSEEVKTEAIKDYLGGYTWVLLEEKYSLHNQTLRRIMEEAGVYKPWGYHKNIIGELK